MVGLPGHNLESHLCHHDENLAIIGGNTLDTK